MPVIRRPPSSGAPPKRTDNRMFTHNLQIRVRRPPSQPSDLELIEAPGPTLTTGAFLARTLWLALDPFVCAPDAAAHDAVKPGDLVPAHGVGEVIESRHEVFGVGSLVVLECGLQQLCVSDGRHARLLHSGRSEEHTSELQSQSNLVCRLLLEKKKQPPHAPPVASPLTQATARANT